MTTTNASPKRSPTTLIDLPPELWQQIADHLETASSLSNFSRTSKSLYAAIEKDGWKSFCRSRFPSIAPRTTPSFRETARTLTRLSRAWDRRAFVARHVEPRGDITSYPGGKQLDRWKPPKGQTIGFTPQLDVYEEVGQTWRDRKETLAFSAGAQVCLRRTSGENVKWTTYRPRTAREGKDDITTMHLLRPFEGDPSSDRQRVVTGTANGDLQMLNLPLDGREGQDVDITYFTTQGKCVRAASVLERPGNTTLLAANLSDARVALYKVCSEQSKIAPTSELEVVPPLQANGNPSGFFRLWSTNFLSPSMLAIGTGPSESPISVYSLRDSGLSQTPTRKFGLQRGSPSSVYCTVPLPTSNGTPSDGNVFLSGAYDGVVRLHDLRSNRDVEQAWSDPADDGTIYNILPRGQEKILVGTSRHHLLKVFDMRMEAKRYNYLDGYQSSRDQSGPSDYNIFLRPNNTSFTARGSGWGRSRNFTTESSVYSLASPSFHSPYIYAGIEGAIWSLAFTEVLDKHPDPVWFEPWSAGKESKAGSAKGFNSKEVLGLAMYDQGTVMKLQVQRSLWETWRACTPRRKGVDHGLLDERWKGANEFGP
ncbi:Autophagy-related 17 [Lecanosticta acicola]|uniref:Autophagy-related 17 n=1 Tax=Lecanosticta acicola TaxID=111012 RepID=A0AAI9E601_9PEZI|nr:Autophagy-related 17 [Lecanosticta acicola]